MSKKIQESYLRLSKAIAENPPVCSEPEYRDLFFNDAVDRGRSPSEFDRIQRQNEQDAKIICNSCPVKALCAEYATLAHEPFGVWGGLSPADRKAIYAFARASKTGEPASE